MLMLMLMLKGFFSFFQVSYIFINRSERVQEFVLTVEPSEAFMLSGNKQVISSVN